MRSAELLFLLDFDAWATERMFATAARLDSASFEASAGPGHAAPRETLLHCVSGMRSWRERLQGPSTEPPAGDQDTARTPAAVQALWREEHDRLRAYAARLADPALGEIIEQRRTDRVLIGERWQFVVHLVLHNMQHRSELAQALTVLGHSPGELGLTAFLQQRGAQ